MIAGQAPAAVRAGAMAATTAATTANEADDLERDTKPLAVGLYVEQYRAAEAQRRARSLEHLVGTLLEQQQALRADFDKQLAAMRLANERMAEWQDQFMAAQRHAQRISRRPLVVLHRSCKRDACDRQIGGGTEKSRVRIADRAARPSRRTFIYRHKD